MPGPRRLVRNARLLLQSAVQHLVDDPALLAVQISRRLPFNLRVAAGKTLRAASSRLPGGGGVAALGAFMAGDETGAHELVTEPTGTRSRMHGEVALLLQRLDLLPAHAPATTRARAAWMLGDLSRAVTILEEAGLGDSRYAERLRSELRLLTPGYRLTPQSGHGMERSEASPDEELRVLHLVTNSLPHTQSGYSVRTHNILVGLREHGIESLALTRTGYPVMVGKVFAADEDAVEGIRYRRTLPLALGSTPESRLQQEVDEALRIVCEFRPHVLHATTDYRNALVAEAVSAATGIPWLFEVRGLMEQTWVASHRNKAPRELAANSEKVRRVAAVETSLALEAPAVVTLGRTMARVLERRGVPTGAITLVPNGVDVELLEENLTPAEAREHAGIGLDPGALAVGAVSALVDYEGFHTLLHAVARIVTDESVPGAVRDHLHVILAGDGSAAPSLAATAEELGIEDRLMMPGRVSRDVARHWVQALDVVVVPRRDLEVARTVTPQKPAEAMALGRPVVMSNLEALRETMTDTDGKEHGILVRPEDPEDLARALTELLQNDERRLKLGSEGREVARQRTWPAMMRRYDLAYRSIMTTPAEGISSGE